MLIQNVPFHNTNVLFTCKTSSLQYKTPSSPLSLAGQTACTPYFLPLTLPSTLDFAKTARICVFYVALFTISQGDCAIARKKRESPPLQVFDLNEWRIGNRVFKDAEDSSDIVPFLTLSKHCYLHFRFSYSQCTVCCILVPYATS